MASFRRGSEHGWISMRIFVIGLFCLLPLLSGCEANRIEGSPKVIGGLVEEEIMLPAEFKNADGSTYIANLDALVIRPDDDQRHPLAVVNHGTDGRFIKSTFPYKMRDQALEFARKGWVAVSFTRRGFGRSDGGYREGSRGICTAAAFERAGRTAAADLREVIRLMVDKPYVDASKVISIGQSSGGYATIALTSNPPPGLVAAVNFAGGTGPVIGGSGPVSAGTTPCSIPELTKSVAYFGKTSRIPMLWVYSANDSHINPDATKQLQIAFTESGGNLELVIAPAFKTDGHHLFSLGGASLWSRYIDDFLEKHGVAPQSRR